MSFGYTELMSQFIYKSMPEQDILIDLPHTDGLKIKGTLRGNYSQPLAIILHGRPGSGNELLPYLYARHLSEYGIASLRLSLYSFSKDTRNLLDTSLETDASDFDTAVRYIRSKGVSRVFGVGHSYGGIAILKSQEMLDAAVLWDPTHGLVFQRDTDNEDYGEFTEKECGDIVIVTTGYGYISSKAAKRYDEKLGDTTDYAKDKNYPLKVITAGKGMMADLGKRYVDIAAVPKEYVVIAGAHHQFEDSDEVIAELFEQSSAWLKKFI